MSIPDDMHDIRNERSPLPGAAFSACVQKRIINNSAVYATASDRTLRYNLIDDNHSCGKGFFYEKSTV
jgi:hypothetical protein